MAGVALVACQNKEEDVVESTCVPEDDVVFYAEMEHEQDTKVFADANLKVLWDADDLITIFNKYTYNRQYRFQGETGDNAGVFKPEPNEEMVTGNEISTIYAVYPYQPSTTISNASVISYVLPENQEYARNSFGKGANLMVSSTEDNFLLFRNVGGYLGIKLYGEGVSISQVSIQGNNGEILSGKASITAPINGIPEISMAADADPLVSVVSATPVALGSSAEDYTEFWFVLPPVTFEEGLTVTVTDAMGRTFQQSTTNTITIERSRITRLAPVEVEIEGQPANQIWYTTSDGEIVEPNNPDGFGANIVSNTYENGLGIITFDQPLTSIGQYAFRGGNLASIIFPEGVEELNNYVCLWCYDLTSVSIPNSVTKITSNAFSGCYNLSSYSGKFATPDGRLLIMDGTVITFAPGGLSAYEIPEGVTVIGGSSFANTQNLRSIVIPEGVTTIEAWAFEGSGLTSINIPNSVESFGTAPFRGCDRLASITGKFASEDERLLVVDGEVIASAMVGLSEYAIPDGITILGYGSFAYSPIVSLVIPEGVWAIDYDVFWACSEMQSIVLPSTIEMILENSFSYCESLQSIIICADVPPEIPSGLFSTTNDCPIYVPDEAILDYVEAENWSEYADRIQGIMYMDIGTEQPNNEIWYTSTDGEIVEPYASVSGSTMISNTYKNGKGIMRFDSEIDAISSNAFKGCENLSSISLPQIVDLVICEGAFMDCYSLTSVELQEGIVWIGDNAFNACPFTSIQLPESLEGIGERAFANTALTLVTIPENTEIGEAAFSNCRSLRSFESEYATEDGLLLIIDAMVNSCAIAGMADVAEYQIPEGVTSIGPLAFAACTKTNFIMPESLNCIYHAAFYCCYGLSDVILPKSVWYIESQAFDACRGMQSITVLSQKPPQGGRSMLDGTNNCPIYVPAASVEAYKEAEYWSEYADRIQAIPDDSPIIEFADENIKADLVAAFDTNGDGEISMAEAAAVTSIDDVFSVGSSNLDPAPYTSFDEFQYFTSVRSIKWSTFRYWGKLTSIILPEGLEGIGNGAFQYCDLLSNCVLPSTLERLGSNVFFACHSLEEITLPESVESVGESVFQACSGLKAIYGKFASEDHRCLIVDGVLNSFAYAGLEEYTFPNEVEVIGNCALRNCHFTGSVHCGRNVQHMGVEAFAYSRMKVITFEEGLKYIAASAIRGCSASSLVIPASVIWIGTGAFVHAFESITFLSTVPPEADGDLFSDNYDKTTFPIYVPAASVEAYQTAPYWSDSADRIHPLGDAMEAVDLGLPSGLKWATCNVGATSPEGYGGYFAWGETETKDNYDWPTYKWCNDTVITKYNYDTSQGDVDNKTVLEQQDDAASVIWGGSWRMPTDAEWTELIENCTWTWITHNGVKGSLVTSNINGNSIFLPADGFKTELYHFNLESVCSYWSSTLDTFNPFSPNKDFDQNRALIVKYYSGDATMNVGCRCDGYSIRPVTE